MSEWKPLSLAELYDEIMRTQTLLVGEEWNFWKLVKIEPEKWQESGYGNEGGGFWVVAICGRSIIWYNDIEDGFNISGYKIYGEIDGYYCNQDKLNEAVLRLFYLVKHGGIITGQASAPL